MTFIVFTGNPPERGATTPSALGSPRGGDISSSVGGMLPPPSSPVSRGDQLHKRIESLVQQVNIYCCNTFDTLVNLMYSSMIILNLTFNIILYYRTES